MLWAPDIIADVEFLHSDESSRRGPLLGPSFGCLMEVGGALHDCRLDLSEVGPVSLGASIRVPIKFLDPAAVVPQLRPGAYFKLRERGSLALGSVVSMVGTA